MLKLKYSRKYSFENDNLYKFIYEQSTFQGKRSLQNIRVCLFNIFRPERYLV